MTTHKTNEEILEEFGKWANNVIEHESECRWAKEFIQQALQSKDAEVERVREELIGLVDSELSKTHLHEIQRMGIITALTNNKK